MKYIVSIIIILLSTFLASAQSDILHIEEFKPEQEVVFECDTVVHININGNIKCKLVFEQSKKDISINNKRYIEIPSTKTDINDNSVLVSEPWSEKIILKLGYDTCYLQKFKKRDQKRQFKSLLGPPDKSKINDWDFNIEFQEYGCLDTDYNCVRLSKNKSDYIDFTCARRVQIYELDLNNDASNEIYLISYIWCASYFKIYRIDVK